MGKEATMFNGIMIASDCADWLEEQKDQNNKDLAIYVREHPSYFGIEVLGSMAIFNNNHNLGMSFIVDLMHFGEGFAEGTPMGVVQDVMRALSVIPETRILQGARPMVGAMV